MQLFCQRFNGKGGCCKIGSNSHKETDFYELSHCHNWTIAGLLNPFSLSVEQYGVNTLINNLWLGLYCFTAVECSFILSEGTSPSQARCFQSKIWKRLEVRNPNRQRAEERVMVVPAFVPRHKVKSGGNEAGCCFHLSFDNFNATTTLSAVKHCYHGHWLCASQKIVFLKVNQDMIEIAKLIKNFVRHLAF